MIRQCQTCKYYGLSRYDYVCCKKKDILVMPESVKDCWEKPDNIKKDRWEKLGI